MKVAGNLEAQLGLDLRRLELEQRFELRQRVDAFTQPDKPDRIELGAKGETEALKAMLLEKLEGREDLRGDKIAAVRERIAAGYYQQEFVVEQMADKILGQSVESNVQGAQKADVREPAYRQALMQDVQSKIESGFYSDGEVMGFVADRLLQIHDVPEEAR